MMKTFRFRPVQLLIPALLGLLLPALATAQPPVPLVWVSGSGNDANPCTRVAPCATFAGALAKMPPGPPGAEIDVLDSGNFGPLTITAPLTINARGNVAGILVPVFAAPPAAVTINAGPNDSVVLRGLTIDGLGGFPPKGIDFLSGGALYIEDCVVQSFGTAGLDFEPAGQASLFVHNSIFRNSLPGVGVRVRQAGGGPVKALFDNVHLEGNTVGTLVIGNSQASFRNSTASGNTQDGFSAAGGQLNLESCVAANNVNNGVLASAPSTVRITNVTVMDNGTGLNAQPGAAIISFGNNRILGNNIDGAPTATVPQH